VLAAHVRTTKEKNLFVFAIIFSSMVWLGVAISLVGLMYAPFIALGVVIGHAFFLARVTGHSIRLGSRQLPELYKRAQEAAAKLGLDRMPEIYVTTGGGVLNAFATKLFSRWFVILHSEVLDACEQLDEGKAPSEPHAVDFILGHELGHLALGHLAWGWFLAPAKLIPLLGPAYSRACEYSADACGLAVVDDADTSSRALAVLSAGGRQAKKISVEGLVEQRHDTGGLIMSLVELNSTHPFLSKRVAAMLRAKNAAIGPEIGRNPLAYFMAPFFGWAAGGAASLFTVYMYVAVIGVMAAIAIPNFEKFQERSKAAAALAEDNKRHDEPAADLANLFGTEPKGGALASGDSGLGGLGLAGANTGALGVQGADLNGGAVGGVAGGVANGALGGLVGTKLDDDDDKAPPPAEAPRFEARTWLKGQIVAKNNDAVANFDTMKAAILVDKLYKAGAQKVYVTDVGVDDKGVYASNLVAVLPEKSAARKKLVDLCTAEFKKQGYTDPCNDAPELYFNWR
jgi:Zn-dependent protease with chaperone function